MAGCAVLNTKTRRKKSRAHDLGARVLECWADGHASVIYQSHTNRAAALVLSCRSELQLAGLREDADTHTNREMQGK